METKPTITYDDFAKLDLRVGTIIAAEPHPNADRLVKLQVDLGGGPGAETGGETGGETRQICAGIKQYYDPATLVGKQIVVIVNLEPRKIRGEVSNGMLLAASALGVVEGVEGQSVVDVVTLTPGKPVPAGSKVS